MSNPVVYFDMAIAGRPVGRIEITLRNDVCPRTVYYAPHMIYVITETNDDAYSVYVSGGKFPSSVHRREEHSS